jgi:hypothetical protein
LAMRALPLPFRRLAAAFGTGVDGFGFGHWVEFFRRVLLGWLW